MDSDRIKAKRKRWYYRHRERILAYRKQHYQQHKEEHNLRSSAYYRQHKEQNKHQAAEQLRQWRNKNPIKVAAQRERRADKSKQYRIDNRERIAAKQKQWRERMAQDATKIKAMRIYKNDHARRTYHRDIQAARTKSLAKNQRRRYEIKGYHTVSQWLSRVEYYGWRCRYCHCDLNENTLTKDHVIPVVSGGTDFASNLVPACKSCNSKKGARRIGTAAPRLVP